MVSIAVASTDGKVVNQHFGKADCFYILNTDEDTAQFELAEVRKVTPICHNGDHEDSQLKQAVERLMDCQYVIVSRIGMRARNAVEALGLEVYELPGLIEESVDQLIRYRKVQELLTGSII